MSVAVAFTSRVASDPGGIVDHTMNTEVVYGTLTLTNNYGTAGSHGDVMSLVSDKVKSQQIPKWVRIWEDQGAGNAPLGYEFLYATGTTQANGKLVVLGTGSTAAAKTGLTEFTQGDAYSTGSPSLNNAVLRFEAAFPIFI